MDDSVLSLGMDASGMSAAASLPPGTPPEEERPGSALSTASRASRIPVLSRSASLRIKGSSSHAAEARPRGEPRPGAPPARGIVRSASSSAAAAGVADVPFFGVVHAPLLPRPRPPLGVVHAHGGPEDLRQLPHARGAPQEVLPRPGLVSPLPLVLVLLQQLLLREKVGARGEEDAREAL
ncbi:uncharacterized protein LOC119584185 isoform X2 [Penaeus monodon]|uniref:uncharacterized protein LOC119584185 isoform X2 n=1 Tax=Penaeus monodon TaxID=6687 RepID=UPI0018A76E49|nr:uncharacterized protein LOC119584185 isoform X2 [Penaeus monodon]